MKLQRVYVKEYKNLREFECDFSDSSITAFIGNNGSGKSNLLEVITRAFSCAKNYASGRPLSIIPPHSRPAVLNCIIEYQLNDKFYELHYNSDIEKMLSQLNAEPPVMVREEISIICGGKKLLKKEVDSALPDSVLLYYAGETLRQKGTAEGTYDHYYESMLKRADSSTLPSLRFMDYVSISDLPLLLLTAAVYKGDYYSRFLDQIGCTEIDSKFSFVLKKPDKAKGTADTYWNATGFVKAFLDEARKYVYGTRDSGAQYYMFFDDPEVFKNISANEYDLFAKLKVLKYYNYLDHIGIELLKQTGESFSSLRLSEGEKQLGLLMLTSTFTADHECLYLFDEFDAYLHPSWQRIFSEIITEIEICGQVILTTHSPLTLGKMKKENIRILRDGEVYTPSADTYNRDITEVLEEIMEVGKRPVDVESAIRDFRNAAVHGNASVAKTHLETLSHLLSSEDPFWVTAEHLMARLER